MAERMTPEDVALARGQANGAERNTWPHPQWLRALGEIEAAWAERDAALKCAESAKACYERLVDEKARADAATAEAAMLRVALEFYADFDSYFAISIFADPPCGAFINDGGLDEYGTMRPGERARKAIARPGAGAKLLERVTALEAAVRSVAEWGCSCPDLCENVVCHLRRGMCCGKCESVKAKAALTDPPAGHPEPSRDGGGHGTGPAPAPAASDVEVEGAAERHQGAPQPPERPA